MTVTSLPVAEWPWKCGGETIRPYGDWWQGTAEEEKKQQHRCTIVGYVLEFTHGNGDVHPAYIIEVVKEPGIFWPMRCGDVKRLLPQRVATGAASDDETLGRDGVDDPHLTGERSGRKKGAAAAARRVANGPRPGDVWSAEVVAAVIKLHGTAEDTQETFDEETGQVTGKKSGRIGTGWADAENARPHKEVCAQPRGRPRLKEDGGVPRERFTAPSNRRDGAAGSVQWTMLDSFLLCWLVASMVAEQTSTYYDQEQDRYAASWDDDKKEYTARSKKPSIGHSHFPTGAAGEGAMTEALYFGYLAIVGFFGMIRCRDMSWHWAVNGRWAHNFVRGIMPFHLFLLIRRFLHFNDSSKKVPRGDPAQPAPPGYDMIFNFRPVMDACNVAWTALVCLTFNLTYDEQMVLCAMHTKLSRRQPNKPIRDGMQARSLFYTRVY